MIIVVYRKIEPSYWCFYDFYAPSYLESLSIHFFYIACNLESGLFGAVQYFQPVVVDRLRRVHEDFGNDYAVLNAHADKSIDTQFWGKRMIVFGREFSVILQ